MRKPGTPGIRPYFCGDSPHPSRARGRRGAALLLSLGALVHCQPGYPLEPTACDDWCFATQRQGCEEDYPEGCVSDCEANAIGRRLPRCEALWLALSDCYRAAPDADFSCVEQHSRPGPICAGPRTELAQCVSPTAGRCVESCLREASECNHPERDCESECQTPTPGCEARDRALYACRLASPVDCPPPGPDQRPSEQIPCLEETLTLLQCAGF
jgi:hypothetical protein